jgi:hypothetical protein
MLGIPMCFWTFVSLGLVHAWCGEERKGGRGEEDSGGGPNPECGA